MEQMVAFKNFTRTTFNLVLFLFSQCVTDRDIVTKKGAVHNHLRFLFVEEIYLAYR